MPHPATLQYGDLSTPSEEYLEMQPIRQAIDDFYVGGWKLAKNVSRYLPKMLGEHGAGYRQRIKSGSYINYFAQIVDYFASALFTQELAVRPPSDADDPSTPGEEPDEDDIYTQFSKNADGSGVPRARKAGQKHNCGKTLNEVMHELIVTALKQKSAWLHVEMPPKSDANSLAEEEAAGAGTPYVFEVPHEQIIDWEYDDEGELRYAVIRQKAALKGPPGAAVRKQKTFRETYEVWLREKSPDVEPVVSWARYVVEYPESKPPRENDPIALEAEGEVSFKSIPLLEMQLSDGLWAGNKLCPMAREHYQRRTTLNAAENRSMIIIPVAKLGPETPSISHPISEAQQNEQRGVDPLTTFWSRGYEVIGQDDSIEFPEPKGTAYEHVSKRINELKDEMFRISHQMAASVNMQAGQVRRSGQSKKEDRAAEALVLAALGRVVRNFGLRLYTTISEARGEDVEWVAHGLDTYEHEEREDLIAESVQLQAVDIPSPTFRKEHAKRIARKLVENMPPATIAQIDREIDEGVDEQKKVADIEQKAHVDELQNPQPPVVAGPGAPRPTPKSPATQTKAAAA